MATRVDPTDKLLPDLALLREAGLDPNAIAGIVDQLTALPKLPMVRRRRRTDTRLSLARAIGDVVRDAAALHDGEEGDAQRMLMLFSLHPSTANSSPAKARVQTREASGVQDRTYRANREGQLLRILADALIELDHLEDIQQWGKVLASGGEVPQTVAMYWLSLFRDHYFRMETSAYALQFDLTTALTKRRDDMADWQHYLRSAIFWNVEFSYFRARFFRVHGPLWFGIKDEACNQMNDSAQWIEYHDPYPEDFMARLRRIFGSLPDPDEDLFFAALADVDLADFVTNKAADWLALCSCADINHHSDKCEIGLVLTHCDLFGQTVEADFERIQDWYRTDRYAVDTKIQDVILNFRTPGRERNGR